MTLALDAHTNQLHLVQNKQGFFIYLIHWFSFRLIYSLHTIFRNNLIKRNDLSNFHATSWDIGKRRDVRNPSGWIQKIKLDINIHYSKSLIFVPIIQEHLPILAQKFKDVSKFCQNWIFGQHRDLDIVLEFVKYFTNL